MFTPIGPNSNPKDIAAYIGSVYKAFENFSEKDEQLIVKSIATMEYALKNKLTSDESLRFSIWIMGVLKSE